MLAGLTVLLAAPARAAVLGPAYFLRATGGMYTASVHPSGLSVYSTSPAYLVLQQTNATAALELNAANRSFPWVAIADTRGGQAGMDCFGNAHLVTAQSRADDFTESDVEFRGLLMQYSTWHFQAGARQPSNCVPAHGAVALAPSIAMSRNSVTLHLDCLIRNCKGTLIAVGQPGQCANPTPVAAGHLGCLPSVSGNFSMSGGLSVNMKIPLFRRSPRSTLIAITVNGKQGPLTRLGSLPPTFGLPPKARPSSLSITCPPTGTIGTPVTVSGSLSPAGPSVPLTLTFVGAGSTPQTVTVTTSSSGAFSTQFTPPSGLVWIVDASFAGDRTRTHSERACGFSLTQS